MSERKFQSEIIAHARKLGWLVYHTYDSRGSEPGFPDLVLVHPKFGTLFRELKTDYAQLTEEQSHWGDQLTASGANWDVWRPFDMDDIFKILSGIRSF